jgi:flagellar basal-body rod protein FlgB
MTVSLLDTATQRLEYLSQVQNLLAANMANIDTPNYTPAEPVSFSDYLGGQNGMMPMRQDNPADFAGTALPAAAQTRAAAVEHSPDGNAVSLDKQLVAISNNQTEQELAANLYRTYMGMYKTALGSPGG